MTCRILNLQGTRAARMAQLRAENALHLAWAAEKRWCAIRAQVHRHVAVIFGAGLVLGFVAGALWMGTYP